MVERGQRSEPAWLREHPGWTHFEREKPPGTQMSRNVWEMETARTRDCVNEIEARKLPSGMVAPLSKPSSNLLRG